MNDDIQEKLNKINYLDANIFINDDKEDDNEDNDEDDNEIEDSNNFDEDDIDVNKIDKNISTITQEINIIFM
jgi:hypothetical protein